MIRDRLRRDRDAVAGRTERFAQRDPCGSRDPDRM
jgi:hypothetical protein